MKKLIYLCVMAVFCLALQSVRAQDKPQDRSKTEERAKPSIPVKVQIVFTEFDGDKKVSSMPYTFMAIADDFSRGPYSASLRNGVRIPVEVDSKDQKTTYMDVGSNIDCGVKSEEDGRFRVQLIIERSVLFPNKSPEGERMVTEPNGQPLIRQFRTSQNLVLKDGQTSETVLSTDPLNGHVIHVSVTIVVQK